MVSGHDPAQKRDGAPLAAGYLSLQSEGHPIQFRNIELLELPLLQLNQQLEQSSI